MNLYSLACLALAAGPLAACTSIDYVPHDGDGYVTIGDEQSATGGVFGPAGSAMQVFLSPEANADDFSAEGDPRVQFMLEVDRTDAPHVLPTLWLDNDVAGQRLNVLDHDRTVSRFATSGSVTVTGSDWVPTDDASVYRLVEIRGTIDAILEGGATMRSQFTAVRERRSGI